MCRNSSIGILGGDARLYYLAVMLAEEKSCGEVNLFCVSGQEKLREKVYHCNSLEELIRKSDIIVGGIPFCRDGVHVNTGEEFERVKLDRLSEAFYRACSPCEEIGRSKRFIAGVIPSNFYGKLSDLGVRISDIGTRDDFAVLNAIPTAEGAVSYIMENTPYTLAGRRVLVIGSGRVGKVLAHKLDRLDAKVTVSTRKASERALWTAYGINACGYDGEFEENVKKADVIVNTSPFSVLWESCRTKIKKEALILDLATNCDFWGKCRAVNGDEEVNRVVKLPSLPAKVAPLTAATYIKTVMDNILAENGG